MTIRSRYVRSRYVLTGVIGFVLGAVVSSALVRGQAATKVDGEFTHSFPGCA